MVQVVVGTLFLILGAVLSVVPGPGLPFILAGLVMLSPHSTHARRLLAWLEARLPDSIRALSRRFSSVGPV